MDSYPPKADGSSSLLPIQRAPSSPFIMLYTVYILFSENHNKIYIGYTSNLLERFKSHNDLSNKGWTIKFRPWKVIYCEYFENKSDAIKREKELKFAKSRERIRQKILIEFKSNGFISA